MLTDKHCKNAVCPPEKTSPLHRPLGAVSGGEPGRVKALVLENLRRLQKGAHETGQLSGHGARRCTQGRDAAKLQKSGGVNPVQARTVEKLKVTNHAGHTFKVVALEWL